MFYSTEKPQLEIKSISNIVFPNLLILKNNLHPCFVAADSKPPGPSYNSIFQIQSHLILLVACRPAHAMFLDDAHYQC